MDTLRAQVQQAEKTREGEITTLKANLRDAQKQLVEKTRTVGRQKKVSHII